MNSAVASPDTTPMASVATVPVEWLMLDHCNPRLMNVDSDTTDEEIIAQLYRAEDLGELLQSIAANGYSASSISTARRNRSPMRL